MDLFVGLFPGGLHALRLSASADYTECVASADWMQRNLNARIETMIPITNPTVHEQVLGQIMWANLADNTNSWILQSDDTYIRNKNNEKSFSAHEYFINNPSLSGRGTALKSKNFGYLKVPGL